MKFDVEDTGEKAGIKFLNRGGFIRERFDKIETMEENDFINQGGTYQTTVIPWLDVRNIPEHFQKNDAFLDMLNYYQGLCEHINKLKRKELNKINRRILEENTKRKFEGRPEEEMIKPFNMSTLENLIVDEELESFKVKLENQFLKYGAKLNMSLSWENPDDNKSLVLSKQVLVEPNPQTSEIFRMLKMAYGKESMSPEDMSG